MFTTKLCHGGAWLTFFEDGGDLALEKSGLRDFFKRDSYMREASKFYWLMSTIWGSLRPQHFFDNVQYLIAFFLYSFFGNAPMIKKFSSCLSNLKSALLIKRG